MSRRAALVFCVLYCYFFRHRTAATQVMQHANPTCENIVDGVYQDIESTAHLGGYTFSEVFGENPDFTCSPQCDGLGTQDVAVCGGPYACGKKSCVQDSFEWRVPYACPYRIETDDSESERNAKIMAECVPCDVCGVASSEQDDETLLGTGRGCATCTTFLCGDDKIYDWTDSMCKYCDELTDIRLCDRFHDRRVSGDIPVVTFLNCDGSDSVAPTYGVCQECPNTECNPDQFLANGCGCRPCIRENTVNGVWNDGIIDQTTYCQVSQDDTMYRGKTGVHPDGKLCRRECRDVVCNADEHLVECSISQDTHCALDYSQFRTATLTASQITKQYVRTNQLWIDASFENALVDEHATDAAYKKQCVYNAKGIQDNYALPAGISTHFSEPGDAVFPQGVKDCEQWIPGSRRSLLPLQNTFLHSSKTHHVFVDCPALVMSYDSSDVLTDGKAQQRPDYDVGNLFLRILLDNADVSSVKLAIHADPTVEIHHGYDYYNRILRFSLWDYGWSLRFWTRLQSAVSLPTPLKMNVTSCEEFDSNQVNTREFDLDSEWTLHNYFLTRPHNIVNLTMKDIITDAQQSLFSVDIDNIELLPLFAITQDPVNPFMYAISMPSNQSYEWVSRQGFCDITVRMSDGSTYANVNYFAMRDDVASVDECKELMKNTYSMTNSYSKQYRNTPFIGFGAIVDNGEISCAFYTRETTKEKCQTEASFNGWTWHEEATEWVFLKSAFEYNPFDETFMRGSRTHVSESLAERSESWPRQHVMVECFDGGEFNITVTVTETGYRCHLTKKTPCFVEIPLNPNALKTIELGSECTTLQIRPAPLIFECPGYTYLNADNKCVECEQDCAENERDVDCGSFATQSRCESCGTIDNGRFTGNCEVTCNTGYYLDDNRNCAVCTPKYCEPGYQAVCENNLDTTCQPCPALDVLYGQYQKYTDGCNTKCIETAHEKDGRCLPCTTFAELQANVANIREEVSTQNVFYRYVACTDTSDSRYEQCYDIPDGILKTDGSFFGHGCFFECNEGFYKDSGSCTGCNALPLNAIWNTSESDECAWVCKNGPFYKDVNTCNDCAGCPVGTYPTSPCDPASIFCQACTNTLHGFEFSGPGSMDHNASCPRQCMPGTFDKLGLGECVHHTTVACRDGQFFTHGTPYQDNFCTNCSTCEGQKLVSECTSTADSECRSCGESSHGKQWVGNACNFICTGDYLRVGDDCKECLTSCDPGTKRPHTLLNCSHCIPCASPEHVNAALVKWISACDFGCVSGYELINGSCILTASQPVQHPSVRMDIGLQVLCDEDEYITSAGCLKCTDRSDMAFPSDKTTWEWKRPGRECEWVCKESMMKYQISENVFVCLSYAKYDELIHNQRHQTAEDMLNQARQTPSSPANRVCVCTVENIVTIYVMVLLHFKVLFDYTIINTYESLLLYIVVVFLVSANLQACLHDALVSFFRNGMR